MSEEYPVTKPCPSCGNTITFWEETVMTTCMCPEAKEVCDD